MNTYQITIPKQYYPLVDPKIGEIVEPSGRCTAKSTSNEVAAIALMLQSHKNNIWYCRAESGDLRNAVYNSFYSTAQLMGVEKLFCFSLSPMQATCLVTGAKCYFTGINGKTDDDVTATKGFTPQGKTLAMCILDEADQVKHQNHITGWQSTATRFLLPYGKFVFAYNPPMMRTHWAHEFFAKKVQTGAIRIYATWEDIRSLLTPRTVADILHYKATEPEYYRYWYLGESIILKGMVYPQLKREKHFVNIFKLLAEGDRVVELILGLDEGTVYDSTCVTALALMMSGRAIVLDCFENDPLVGGQQAPTEQSRNLKRFIDGLLNKFQFLKYIRRRWIFECAEGGQMLMLQFQTDWGEECLKVTNKSIFGDIKRVRSMLQEGILLFHVDVNVNTLQLVKDMEAYMFDEKTGEVKKEQRDDTIDSLEYATKLYYNVPMSTRGGLYGNR